MLQGAEFTATVGTSSGLFIGPSAKRRALRISAPPSGHITLSTRSTAVDGAGIVLNQGNPALLLCPDCVGNLVTNAWYAIASPATVTVGGVEVIEVDTP